MNTSLENHALDGGSGLINTCFAFLVTLGSGTIDDALFFFIDSNPPTNVVDDSGDSIALVVLVWIRRNVRDRNKVELDCSRILRGEEDLVVEHNVEVFKMNMDKQTFTALILHQLVARNGLLLFNASIMKIHHSLNRHNLFAPVDFIVRMSREKDFDHLCIFFGFGDNDSFVRIHSDPAFVYIVHINVKAGNSELLVCVGIHARGIRERLNPQGNVAFRTVRVGAHINGMVASAGIQSADPFLGGALEGRQGRGRLRLLGFALGLAF